MSQVSRIETQSTAGEIGALLVENAAIKAETPLYNRRQRQVRKLWTIHLNRSRDNFLQPVSADFSPWGERALDSYGLFHNRRHVDNTFGGTPVTTDSACVCLDSTRAKGLAFSTS